MTTRRQLLEAALLGVPAGLAAGSAAAQTAASPAATLFAVEFRTGARWDTSKEAQEQLHFREHSANLKRLRDEGRLLLGARYSDKGLIVVSAATEDDVRLEIARDPSIEAQVFQYEVHPFQLFYSGCLGKAATR